MTRLALFDLDDTLLDTAKAYRRWVEAFSTSLASAAEPSAEDLSLMYDVDFLDVTLKEQVERLHAHFGLDGSAEEFWEAFRQTFPRYQRCEPATMQGLVALRNAGWKVGIVTNGPTQEQGDKIRFSGLDRYVDGWSISEQVGARKPELAIFTDVASQLAVPLSHGGWMVGDNLSADIAGGQAAGLETIWIHHGRQRGGDEIEPGHSCANVGEAARLILGA